MTASAAALDLARKTVAAIGGPATLEPGHLSETRFVWRAWELPGLGRGLTAQAHQGFTAVVWISPAADRIVCRIQPLPHGFGFGLSAQHAPHWPELRRLDEAQLFPLVSQLTLVLDEDTNTFQPTRAMLFGRTLEPVDAVLDFFRLCNLSCNLTAAELSEAMVDLLAGSVLAGHALPATPERAGRIGRPQDVTPLRRGQRLPPVPATAPTALAA